MIGIAIILAAWFALGATGAWLAYRGSKRTYGKDIYGRGQYALTAIFGFPGFVGSMVAW